MDKEGNDDRSRKLDPEHQEYADADANRKKQLEEEERKKKEAGK